MSNDCDEKESAETERSPVQISVMNESPGGGTLERSAF